MSTIKGFVDFVLYQPEQQHFDDTTGKAFKTRVKRIWVPKRFIQLWEKLAGKPINVRTVAKAGSITPLYVTTRNVPENEQTAKFARLNQSTIAEYLDEEQQYLETLPHWQGIKESDRDRPELRQQLRERTQEIAAWLASAEDGEYPPGASVKKILGNRREFASKLVTKAQIREATNIALEAIIQENPVSPLYATTQNVPENTKTARFARLNQNTIDQYLQKEQQQYLETFSHWQDIRNRDRNSTELRRHLQERTREIAVWLASTNGPELPPHAPLDQVLGNRREFASQLITKEQLHEATNIALRTMIAGGEFRYDRSLNQRNNDFFYENRLFPESNTLEDNVLSSPEVQEYHASPGKHPKVPFSFDRVNDRSFVEHRMNHLRIWDNIYEVMN